MKENQNKIWIELDKPLDNEHGIIQCQKANTVLRKLGVALHQDNVGFQLNQHKKGSTNYIYVLASSHEYTELSDNGKWFSLDYLAK
jgi:hypothetical protein